MHLIIDNYDSFTYNLFQYLLQMGLSDIKVIRNDRTTVSEIEQMAPEGIIISPGPGRPENAGISVEVVRQFAGKIPILGVCLGHQAIGYAFGARIVGANEIVHGILVTVNGPADEILDFSVIAKARPGGPDYLYALLTGYSPAPQGFELAQGMSYNAAFPGHQIAMPNVLSDGVIAYTDGTEPTVENYARDISAFLMWAAEPKLEERHRVGAQVMIFLIVFLVIMYLAKRVVWARLHRGEKESRA